MFGGLERQRQAEQHGRGHVDPEDLQRRNRQGGAGQDRGQDHQALAEVGRQGPGDEFHQVVVDAAAFLDRGGDGGEVVVGEHHRRRLLGDVGAAAAHGDADIGLLQGRGVVHAVAGHGDDLALGLERAHQAQLLLGFDAGENVRGARGAAQLDVVQGRQFAAGEGAVVGSGDADLAGDGEGGGGVVAGDHFHGDAGAMAGAHRGDGARPRRVEHTGQAEEDQVAGQGGFGQGWARCGVFAGAVFRGTLFPGPSPVGGKGEWCGSGVGAAGQRQHLFLGAAG